MKRNKPFRSWSETFRLNHRALKLFYKRCPQLVLSRIIYAVWTALTPYIGICLSALLVEELASGQHTDRLYFLALLSLISAAGVSLITALIKRWRDSQNMGIGRGLRLETEHILSDKLLEMDYVNLVQSGTLKEHSTILQNMGNSGWGLHRVLRNYVALCSALFTLFGGVSLTVSLFLLPVPQSAGAYALLNSPVFVFLIIAVMLAITYLAPMLANRAGKYWVLSIGALNLDNRIYSFLSHLKSRREIAADVRIYRQDKMGGRFLLEKEGTFGSSGPIAKCARGPMGLYRAASGAVSVIFTGIVYTYVCLKAWAGAFGPGAVTRYVASVTKVSDSVSRLIAELGDMRNNAPFLEQTFSFLDLPDRMYQGSLTVEKRRDRQYDIEFRDVSFRYPGSGQYALRHVSMKFEIGRRLAVVGMNGSGKTTFIKLLCRLYDPTEGEILLNGIDIRKYNYREYMALFSVVFQDFQLFALKLGENVASKTGYDNALAADSLRKAGFSKRLSEFPNGLETYLYQNYDKNGVNISGGEAQKIAIARALCKDAPFIILDEPTAALDPVAEAEIYSNLNEIVGDKTAVYISHRLSSCKFCDEIIVFHEGTIIQRGAHADLLAEKDGRYYELWHAQAQYYTETDPASAAL